MDSKYDVATIAVTACTVFGGMIGWHAGDYFGAAVGGVGTLVATTWALEPPDFAYQFDELKCIGTADSISPEILKEAEAGDLIKKKQGIQLSQLKYIRCSICYEEIQEGEKIWLYSFGSHATHRKEDCSSRWLHCPYCGSESTNASGSWVDKSSDAHQIRNPG